MIESLPTGSAVVVKLAWPLFNLAVCWAWASGPAAKSRPSAASPDFDKFAFPGKTFIFSMEFILSVLSRSAITSG